MVGYRVLVNISREADVSFTEIAVLLDPLDERYVRDWFIPLDVLAPQHGWDAEALRHAIAERRVPRPTYVLGDGTAMLPADYFAFVGDTAASASLHERFVVRYFAACARLGRATTDEDCDAEWNGYLGGGYGACLKEISPEAIVFKLTLVERIEGLLAQPAPLDRTWIEGLRTAVDTLDAIEKPFARFDRMRYGGSVTRDRLIDDVRARFPGIVERS